jgi:proteic killer suppression protein
MEVRFRDGRLDRLETDPKFDGGFSQAVVRVFRKRLQFIRDTPDERVFYQMRSLRFEKLKGKRKHQYSMRLNDQWRLILELDDQAPTKVVVVVAVEDYH